MNPGRSAGEGQIKAFEGLMTMIKDTDRKVVVLPLNWVSITAAAVFWSYGYFAGNWSGVPPLQGLPGLFAVSLALYGIFLTFLLLAHYQKAFYADTLVVRKSDAVALCALVFIMGCLSFNELTGPLVDDQLFHSQDSQSHGISVVRKLGDFGGPLGQLPFSLVLHLCNIATLGLLAGVYLFLRRREFPTKVMGLSLLFWGCRAVALKWGFLGAHPPLRLFPLWLSSSLLSSSDLSFRLPQFLGLVLGMWGVQRLTRPKLGLMLSWLLALCAGTIPLLWHVGTMAEQSIWTAVVWTLFLLAFETQDNPANFKWARWVAILALATMLRQSAFLAFIPLALFYAIYADGKDKYAPRTLALLLAPVLLMLPFLIRSLIAGTPATYVPAVGEANYIPFHASTLARVWYALRTGIVPWVALHSVLLPWVMFPVFAFLPRRGPARVPAALLLLFFALAVVMFFSIRPVLWGIDRYQAEYVVPFAVVGFYRLLELSRTGPASWARACVVGCVVLVVWNTFVFWHYSTFLQTGQVHWAATLASESVYDYRAALKAARHEGYAGHTYLVGITYGVLPEIINGFTVAQVAETRAITIHQDEMKKLKNISWADADPAAIDASPEIMLVLISDHRRPQDVVEALGALGWRHWRDFAWHQSGTVIYGMVRGAR